MRNLLLAIAAVPLASLAVPVLPAGADTVVRRETTTIITREAAPRVVERRYDRAPQVHYYTAPRRTYAYTAPHRAYAYTPPRRAHVAPRRYSYTSTTTYTAPRYYSAPAYGYSSGDDDGPYAYVALGGDCDGLYRRAVDTGSPYWWSRYHNCMD